MKRLATKRLAKKRLAKKRLATKRLATKRLARTDSVHDLVTSTRGACGVNLVTGGATPNRGEIVSGRPAGI